MESALNLALDFNGVMDTALPGHGLSAARLAALKPHLTEVRAEITSEMEAGVLGFMTLPHQYQDIPAELPGDPFILYQNIYPPSSGRKASLSLPAAAFSAPVTVISRRFAPSAFMAS